MARSTGFIPQDKILKLPTRWSDQDRNTHLSVSPDGRDLSYQGPSTNSEKDAAAARTLHHIPPACGIYYYEVEITAKDQKAFAGKGVKYGRLPGWEPNSWGYYGEDGTSLSADKSGSQYGQPYGGGDTIGCGIDFTTHKAFYTKNGTLIGPVFDNVGKNLDLFPSVGLQHAGDSIRANFGQEPFKYDIDYHVQQQYNTTWNKISETPLDRSLLQGHRRAGFSIASITNDVSVPVLTEQESKHVLTQLVMSYLVHHGYAKTARALEYQQRVRDTNASTPTDSSDPDVEMNSSASDAVDIDIETRTSTVNAVLAGDIDTAMDSLRTCYPSVLEVDNHLMLFKLRCRKFVELILETTEIKKKMKALREKEAERNKHFDEAAHEAWLEEEMNMDIDDDAAGPLVIRPILENIPEAVHESEESSEMISDRYESALNAAINYGQCLSSDYQSNPQPEVQDMFRTTLGIVAWDDPTEAGGSVAELVSHNARIALAHEVNQAILKSQGRPAQPALETVYRHTSTCITQLGLLGVGAAAFADMPREFFQAR
ncbi:hypothetical protein HYPSUDRAFT_50788 [Hypholoma sublateritium FD-334 SS-4]|uniref:Uncharacterized protein n=1 Tax=Hypholoma sublateritium (strain FD-334 SS-4) TaxID=945553 RepID=A0A0D2QCL1_HYPSF|nr:hypothetical protein HYPSUDRAFT_50788 [Hypholoma sublateritium FD-334 SS-4]